MANPLFTWTHNGVEYTTNPFKVIPIVEGVDDENAGKPKPNIISALAVLSILSLPKEP